MEVGAFQDQQHVREELVGEDSSTRVSGVAA